VYGLKVVLLSFRFIPPIESHFPLSRKGAAPDFWDSPYSAGFIYKLTHYFRLIIRFLVVWFVDTISLLVTAWVITGISINPVGDTPVLVVATAAALLLGIVNLLIRPLILLIAMPLGWAVIFLVGFIINAVVLMITSSLLPGLEVDGWCAAFIGGLFPSLVNTILTTLLDIDNDESFYANLVIRQAAKQSEIVEGENTRGVVMLEIDGLSYWHIQKAVEDGYMPTIKKLMDEDGYKISRVDCGLPATTPACQAGILQGNNTNIPAFRWLDKESNRILAGGQAAAEIEPELSDGHGLLEGGSSISNMSYSLETWSRRCGKVGSRDEKTSSPA
jgi:uncharacterized membrane protein YvlD (DUF360 family)